MVCPTGPNRREWGTVQTGARGSASRRWVVRCACSRDRGPAGPRSESGEGTDARKMADAGNSAGAIDEASIGGDVGTVQFHRQCEERGVVEGETEFPAQTGGALQEGQGRRGDDERQCFQAVDDVVEPRGSQQGLEQQDVADLVQQQGRHVHLEGLSLYLLQQGACLFEQILIACLEPLDEDRGVNDDLCGRSGSRDSNG